jgi:dimethylhistidine N-methyltransferase
LFEAITRLPEYYLTRAETEILTERCGEFRELIGSGRAVVEFGSGSSVKTPLLLGCIAPAAYVPLDISGDFLRSAVEELARKLPDLPIYPVEADFMREVALPAAVRDLPKLGFFPGSTIGNMVARTAVDLLRSMRATLGAGSQLLIGMDLIKDVAVLEAAYDDAEGVTAAFNLNLARRINRELGGTLPLDRLRHRARWNDTYARIEMHLEAAEDFEFEVSGRGFAMRRGETIHTENSHKFDLRSQNTLLLAGGWTPRRRWLDGEGRFSLILADWTIPRGAP